MTNAFTILLRQNRSGNLVPGRSDFIADSQVEIDTIHSRIHEGLLYTVNVVNTALASGGTIIFLVRTDPNQNAHIRSVGKTGGAGRLELFEAPTITGIGSLQPRRNKNRISTNIADTLVYLGPTFSATGTKLDDQIIPGSGGFFISVGAQASFNEEWVLNFNTDYLLRLTNNAGTAQPVQLSLDFYEP